VKGPPLVFDIEKPNASAKWSVGNLPVAKQVFIEVIGTGGFKRIRTEPRTAVNVGEAIIVTSGSSDKSAPLLLKLATSGTAGTIDVKLQSSVKLDGSNDARAYRRKDIVNLQAQKSQELDQRTRELNTAKRSNPQREEEKEVKEATIARLSKELVTLNTVLDQLRYVLDFANATEGQAKISFRVYCLAGDTKIDLLKTGDDAPPEKAK
jgi:hypothetical protein